MNSEIGELAAAVRDLTARINARQWARWLSITGAAEYASVDEERIQDLIDDGVLIPSRALGRLRIDRQELDNVLKGWRR